MNWLAAISAIVLLTASQALFAELHQRRYGRWRSMREHRLLPDRDERRLMWIAITHRDYLEPRVPVDDG